MEKVAISKIQPGDRIKINWNGKQVGAYIDVVRTLKVGRVYSVYSDSGRVIQGAGAVRVWVEQ